MTPASPRVRGVEVEDGPFTVLHPDGTLEPSAITEDVPTLDLRRVCRWMVLARSLDAEAIALQRQGELGLFPSLLGQEAAQVGATLAMRAQDRAFPTYREHAVALSLGVEPISILGLFRGTTMGGWDPMAHPISLYSLVIGAQTLHGVGFAMGVVRDGDVGTGEDSRDRAVLVFLGDGALSEGETNEAFVWAGAQALPMVFFCQNNQWAISAPYSVQSAVPAFRRAGGFGFEGVQVDGNDVIACHAVTTRALDKARAGEGPTLIEALTYRRNPHTTSDDDIRYRTSADTEPWIERDPIDRLRLHLEATDAEAAPFLAALDNEANELAAEVRSACRTLPQPTWSDPFDHTLTALTAELRAQRQEHAEFVARLSESEES